MPVLSLTLSAGNRPVDPDLAASFGLDVERQVGAVSAHARADPLAKGTATDVATIAVAILSSQAVTHLVAVLKSWFERDRSLEVEVAFGDRKIRIRGADGRRMSAFDLEGLIDRAITGQQGEEIDAPRDPGRV